MARASRSLAATVGAMNRGSAPAHVAYSDPGDAALPRCWAAARDGLYSSATCSISLRMAACSRRSRCSCQWRQRDTTSWALAAAALSTVGLKVHCASSERRNRALCCCTFCSRSCFHTALRSATATAEGAGPREPREEVGWAPSRLSRDGRAERERRANDEELGLASDAGTVRKAPASYSRAVLRIGEKGLSACARHEQGSAHDAGAGTFMERLEEVGGEEEATQ